MVMLCAVDNCKVSMLRFTSPVKPLANKKYRSPLQFTADNRHTSSGKKEIKKHHFELNILGRSIYIYIYCELCLQFFNFLNNTGTSKNIYKLSFTMESLTQFNYFCDILHAKDFVLQIQCKCNVPPPPSLSIHSVYKGR